MPSDRRSHSSTTYTSRLSTTIAAPTGVQDGDILLLTFLIGASGTPPTPTLPTGFTVIEGPSSVTDGSNFTVTRRLARKVASSEPADYTITHSSASSQALMVAVQGGDVGAAAVSTNNSGDGEITTALGVTTPVDDSYVAFIVHNWNLYGGAEPPTGTTPTFTERLDEATSLLYFADGVMATAGATGDKTHDNLNAGGGGGFELWGAFLVSVPASTTGQAVVVGSSVGSATVTGVGQVIARSTGSSEGTTSGGGISETIPPSIVGTITGSSDVFGIGASLRTTTGTITSTSTVSGQNGSFAGGETVGSIIGSASVMGVASVTIVSVGSAGGVATVTGLVPGFNMPVFTPDIFSADIFTLSDGSRIFVD